jgi:hypothetical protein
MTAQAFITRAREVTVQEARRKVFISFYGGDEAEVGAFINQWADRERVFIPKVLHDAYNGVYVDSANTDYVMGRIRAEFIGDSTVTMVLMGPCTHSRRYVDWELKASLRQGDVYTANGLLAVNLPSAGNVAQVLPPRFAENYTSDNTLYARYYRPPQTAAELAAWIEDAYQSRTKSAARIKNGADAMGYNRKCKVHDITH